MNEDKNPFWGGMRVVLSCSRISPENEVGTAEYFSLLQFYKIVRSMEGRDIGDIWGCGRGIGFGSDVSLTLPDIACKVNFAVLVTF